VAKTVGLYRRGRVWWMRYSHHGKQIQESAKTTKKSEAEALLGKRKAAIHAGTFFPEKRTATLTVGELRDRWLKHAKDKRSLSDDELRFGRIVDFFGEKRAIAAIETSDVDEFRDALLEEKVRGGTMSKTTANRHLALLRSALRYAEREGHLTQRPAVRMFEERNSRANRVASDEELAALLEAADRDPKFAELKLAIVVGRWSGMRLGEIVHLTWERVDLKQGVVTLREIDTKTGEGRVVPLGAPAFAALKASPRRLDGRVFTKKRETFSSEFSQLVRAAGIEDLHFHDLRGTRLTELRRAGADIKELQAISGHKTLSTLVNRYQAISVEELLEVSRRADRKKPR
jgi:integrase